MLAFLPLFSLFLLILIFNHPDENWRRAIFNGAVFWGVLIALSTEVLSIFRLINFGSILIFWSLTVTILGFIYYRLLKFGKRSLSWPNIFSLTPISLVFLAGIVFIVTVVGLIAIVAPSNNWDSMTYHMARVVHWIQNHSVAHYPTYYSAQLVHPPWAEFAIMHLQILSGGDRLANLVQWLAMVGSIIGVSLIAQQLGADRRGEIFASVFCATIPMGILQASSTQNDYVVAFWLVCLAHYILLALSSQGLPNNLILGIGASLGLGIFTKTSTYLYAFPLMLWFTGTKFISMRGRFWKPILLILGITLILNVGHFARNIDLYGSPVTMGDYEVDYKIEIYSLPTFISNILRNISLHTDIIRYLKLDYFIEPLTGKTAKIIRIIHSWIGVDANDPRITYPPNSYTVPGLSFDENVAGNPLHLLLIFIAIIVFIFHKNSRKNYQAIWYFLIVLAGFLLLCFMTKIQPYHSRHHLSIFVLFSAWVGLVFSQAFNRYLINAIIILLMVTSMQFVFYNKFRPIATENNIFNTPRNELYFIGRSQLKDPYFRVADFISNLNCSKIALSLGVTTASSGTYWEYPFWALIKTNHNQIVEFEHIVIEENLSGIKKNVYPHNNFIPCAIISVRNKGEPTVNKMVIRNNTYLAKWSELPITVLLKQ